MSTEHPKWASGVTSSKINLMDPQQSSADITGNILWVINGLFAGGLQVQDRDLLATPSGSNGFAWIIAASGTITGIWDTDGASNGDIAIYWNGWYYVTPDATTAIMAFILDENQWWSWSSSESEWHPMQEIWSATEHFTGKYSRAGGKLYSKTVDFKALPDGTPASADVAHGITTIDFSDHVSYQTSLTDNVVSGKVAHGSPPWILDAGIFIVDMVINDTNIHIDSNFDSSDLQLEVRIEYTKV